MSLTEYKRKRQNSITTEPLQIKIKTHSTGEWRKYCVQRHDAKRAGLHEDFRFEDKGVAVSFAFPKRMKFNDSSVRLAIRTEDHPLEYLLFEGVIEKGYGAGTVRLIAYGKLKLFEWSKKKLEVGIPDGKRKGHYTFTNKGGGKWLVRKL